MTMRVRAVLMLMVAVAMMGLASCDHYVCTSGANFGSSTCTAGTVGLSGGGNEDAAFLFVSNGTGAAGAIAGYTLNTTNSAAPTLQLTNGYTAPVTPGNDVGLGMALAQKQFVYTAYSSTGQIFGWTISSSGILSAVSGSPYSVPSLHSLGSLYFDTQRVITNPAGTLLFVADAAHDQIFVYQIGSGGALSAVTGSPFSVAPYSPGNMTTDGLGNYLYFTQVADNNHTGTELGAYKIGTGSSLGQLTEIAAYDLGMWQVLGEPTGKFLIGTTGQSLAVNDADNPNLYVFSIGSSGAITLTGTFATTNSPLNIAVQSNSGGSQVYSFGIADSGNAFNPIEAYALSSSGTLTAANGSPFDNGAVGDFGQFDQSGGFVFVYGGIGEDGTVVYQMTAFQVDSDGLALPAITGTYGGYWVVTDPQ